MKRLILILLSLLFLAGCSANPLESHSFLAMDTVVTISLPGEYLQEQKETETQIMALADKFDCQKEGSLLSEFNRGLTVTDAELCELAGKSAELKQKTGGAFCAELRPLTKLWQNALKTETLPDDAEIRAALKKIDSGSIKTQGDTLLSNGVQLDFGGIAKGYITQKAAESLNQKQVSEAVLSLGGNIGFVGKKNNGGDFTVSVENPRGDASIGTVSVKSGYVSTSGDYQRYVMIGGKRYHHIIDPSTGYPADSDLISVSVFSLDACLADAYSTALFIMGKDKVLDFYKQNGGFEAVLITKNQEIFVTGGLKDNFKFNKTEGFRYEP